MISFNENTHSKFKSLKFIDLFAGIGGFRYALNSCGADCVFSSEWDEYAQNTYYENFGELSYGGGVGVKTGSYLINGKVRRLCPRECAQLNGFSDSFIINENKNQAYKQFGNGVVIDVIQKILIQLAIIL